MISKKSVKLKGAAWARLVKRAYIRDCYRCQIPGCMDPGGFSQLLAPHHIIPKGRLRLDILENILTTCKSCHRLLHDNNLDVSVDDLIDKYDLRGYLKCETN